ncbi:MAG: hypothetical protein ACR2PR_08135 [Pseudohongiellaceae bacterium]
MSRHDMFNLAKELQVEQAAIEEIVDTMNRVTFWQMQGYSNLVEKPAGCWCGIARFIYTVGVCVGLDMSGYRRRFCFDSWQNAELFLKEWDGVTLPVVGVDGCKAIK